MNQALALSSPIQISRVYSMPPSFAISSSPHLPDSAFTAFTARKPSMYHCNTMLLALHITLILSSADNAQAKSERRKKNSLPKKLEIFSNFHYVALPIGLRSFLRGHIESLYRHVKRRI